MFIFLLCFVLGLLLLEKFSQRIIKDSSHLHRGKVRQRTIQKKTQRKIGQDRKGKEMQRLRSRQADK